MKPKLHWKIFGPRSDCKLAELWLGALSSYAGAIYDNKPDYRRYAAWCMVDQHTHTFFTQAEATIYLEKAVITWFEQLSAGACPEGSISYLEPEVTP